MNQILYDFFITEKIGGYHKVQSEKQSLPEKMVVYG